MQSDTTLTYKTHSNSYIYLFSFIREKLTKGYVYVHRVLSRYKIADVFTNALAHILLAHILFHDFRNDLNIHYPSVVIAGDYATIVN